MKIQLTAMLEDVTARFWYEWRNWRQGQGWVLGPREINHDSDSSVIFDPAMVALFVDLPKEERDWFRAHAALVLGAVQPLLDAAMKQAALQAPVSAEVLRLREEVAQLKLKLQTLSAASTQPITTKSPVENNEANALLELIHQAPAPKKREATAEDKTPSVASKKKATKRSWR